MNSWHDESIVQYTLGFVEKLLWEAVESSEKVEVEIIESFADDVTKKELARFNHNNILADLNEDYDQQNPVLTVLEDIEQDEDHDEYQDVVVFGESHCQRVDQSLDVAEMLRRRDAQSIRSPLSANMSTSVMSIYEGVERFDEQCSFSSDSYANVDIDVFEKTNKDGYLYKRSTNIFVGWQLKYVVLHNTKLYYAKTQNHFILKKNINVLNFKVHKCKLENIKEDQFTIAIIGTKTKLKFRCGKANITKDWIIRLTQVLDYVSLGGINFENNAPNNEKVKLLENLTEEEFLNLAQTGDILLFQSNQFKARLQRSVTFSDYDHVALLVKVQDELYVFDATSDRDVSLIPWKEFKELAWYKSFVKTVYRRLLSRNKIQDLEDKIYKFITSTAGITYQLNLSKLLRFTKRTSKEGYFCSELIAEAYIILGILDPKKSSSSYWPGDFGMRRGLKLLKGADLSDDILVNVLSD